MNKVFKKNNTLNPGRGAIENCRSAPEIDGSFRFISGRRPEEPISLALSYFLNARPIILRYI